MGIGRDNRDTTGTTGTRNAERGRRVAVSDNLQLPLQPPCAEARQDAAPPRKASRSAEGRWSLVAVAVVVWLAAVGAGEAKDRAAEKAFRGDGVLFRSFPMPLFIGRWMECGYGVAFGSFPAGSAFEAEYQTGPLPDTLGKNYEVVLALDSAEDSLGEGWTASFSIEDAAGTVVLSSDGVEGGSWEGGGRGHVYQMLPKGWKEFVGRDEWWFTAPRRLDLPPDAPDAWPGTFKARPGERYRVKVRYAPGPGATETRGHFEIRQPVSM